LAGAAASLLEGVITPADGDGDASNIAKKQRAFADERSSATKTGADRALARK